jgi:hypothetical protein
VGEFSEVPDIQPSMLETANEAIQKDAPVKNITLTAVFLFLVHFEIPVAL